MSIELNHTIVHVKDRWAAARAVGDVLGLPEAGAYGPFAELKLDNDASLDFMDTEGEIHGQHYAFLVSEDEFDLIWVDCGTAAASGGRTPKRQPHEINHEDVAAASIGRAPMGTGWRSSLVPTAAAADLRIAAGTPSEAPPSSPGAASRPASNRRDPGRPRPHTAAASRPQPSRCHRAVYRSTRDRAESSLVR